MKKECDIAVNTAGMKKGLQAVNDCGVYNGINIGCESELYSSNALSAMWVMRDLRAQRYVADSHAKGVTRIPPSRAIPLSSHHFSSDANSCCYSDSTSCSFNFFDVSTVVLYTEPKEEATLGIPSSSSSKAASFGGSILPHDRAAGQPHFAETMEVLQFLQECEVRTNGYATTSP